MKNLIFFLFLSIALCACGPTELQQQATITQIAADVMATQTASVPTATSTNPPPTATRTPPPTHTSTPTLPPTETPIPSPTRQPDLVSKVIKVNVFLAPIKYYGIDFYLIQGETAEVIGRDGDCTWLKIRGGDGKEGWVQNDPEEVEFNLACSDLPLGSYRPKSGYLVIDHRTVKDQEGELEVQNGLLTDGVIILTDLDDQPIYGFYVRSQSTKTLENIPYGTYKIFFSTGNDWLAGANKFGQDAEYQKFDDLLKFDAYTIWAITLHPVVGGQAGTDRLSESEFPSLDE